MGEYAEGKTVDVFSEMLDEVAIGCKRQSKRRVDRKC
jgi:hypothetical protein